MKRKLIPSINLANLKNRYWLKTELMHFCRNSKLSTLGSKQEIIKRIEVFITTGNKIKPILNKSVGCRDSDQPITTDTFVVNYKNDATTRKFFVKHIGQHFRFNAYLRQFTNKNNIRKGLSYGDLVDGWLSEESRKKDPHYKSKIGKQFEYNQFTRDFMSAEKGKSRSDVIKAWEKVKASPGPKTYIHYISTILRKTKS